MSKPEPLRFPLDDLLDALVSNGFYLGVDTHLRLQRFLDWFVRKTNREPATLKYQLAALLCSNEADQQRFYTLFDQKLAHFIAQKQETTASEKNADSVEDQKNKTEKAEKAEPKATPATSRAQTTQPTLTEGKSGPVRVELKFPSNDLRIWNLSEIDQAVRPLREKEWATVLEWDIPATIRSTIRAGGMPTFELRRRKRAPQYLLLIDQRGPRDHLAGLYAELAIELNRRDVDAEHYFYDRIPGRCWKDRRDYGSYTSIESLQSQFPGSRLLLIGEPEGLLDLPQLRPSNLAADLRDAWPQTALLCTRPTAEWGNAELTLCQMFPVVPANAAGLASLTLQWAATEVYAPQYWKIKCPEATVPPVRVARPQEAEPVLENLRYYLGRDGFLWLCAAALYPELYYELTALLHDESIPPPAGLQAGDWDMNRVWWTALLRLSRLDWFRKGNIPLPAREKLRQYFDQNVLLQQRGKVWEQLVKLLEITSPPPGSFAADSLQVTLDWYKTEQQMADPQLTEVARQQLGAEFWSKTPTAIINDPLARRIAQYPDPSTQAPIDPVTKGRSFGHKLSVRSGPGASYPIVYQLEPFSALSIFETTSDGNWHRIGEGRWVSAQYVELEQTTATTQQQTGPPRILWVDDHPDNTTSERASLQQQFGIVAVLSASTGDALQQLTTQHFDLVISDAGRGDDHAAGLKLLRGMREQKFNMPFIVYTSATNFDYFRKEFTKAGAAGVFREEAELMGFMSEWIKRRQGKAEQTIDENIGKTQQEAEKTGQTNEPAAAQKAEPEQTTIEQPTINVDAPRADVLILHNETADQEGCDALLKYLRPLWVRVWTLKDGAGQTGTAAWVRQKLDQCQIVLPLVTADFFDSTTNPAVDLLDEIVRRNNPRTRFLVMPILLKPAILEGSVLSQLRTTRPVGGRAVYGENMEDKHFSEIAETLKKYIATFDYKSVATEETPQTLAIREQVKVLITEDKMEEALALLAQHSEDALLLQTQYNNGKKQYNMGIIELSEWQRVQARINYSALELNGKVIATFDSKSAATGEASKPLVNREQIQQLIAQGRTEEALALLAQHSEDAVLLQARFKNQKEGFNMQLIKFNEWERILAQINYAALELTNTVIPKSSSQQTQSSSAPGPKENSVFISYHNSDRPVKDAVNKYLKDNGMITFVDEDDMEVGQNINTFIEKAVKASKYILTIISKKSLVSGWVNQEVMIARMRAENWIAVTIDNAYLNPTFLIEAMEEISPQIDKLKDRIKVALDGNLDIRSFTDDLARLQDIRLNLGTVIQTLKSKTVYDISGENFESGMAKVLEQIRQGNTTKS